MPTCCLRNRLSCAVADDIRVELPIGVRDIIVSRSLWLPTLLAVQLFRIPVPFRMKYVLFASKLWKIQMCSIAYVVVMVSGCTPVIFWRLIPWVDDESMPTVQCTSCSEWHHQSCVSALDVESLTYVCARCQVSVNGVRWNSSENNDAFFSVIEKAGSRRS